jgi:hypothetical protein
MIQKATEVSPPDSLLVQLQSANHSAFDLKGIPQHWFSPDQRQALLDTHLVGHRSDW